MPHFLVDKYNSRISSTAVNDLKERYNDGNSDAGLDFDYIGPWPPYNFCDLPRKKRNMDNVITKSKGCNPCRSFRQGLR